MRLSDRTTTLAAVCLASAAMPLTFTGPALALPGIAADLGGSPLALNWVTNAFMLAFGSCLLAAGALADRHGRRRVFLVGIVLFLLASLGAACAPGLVALDLLRALQGVASAAVFAGGAAALAQAYEDGPGRVRAFSLLGTSFGAGLAFGPVAAGALTEALGWRSIFGLVFVQALVAGALGWRAMAESRDPQAGKLDWPGALSFTAALALFTFGVLHAPGAGWSAPSTLALLAASLALGIVFVQVERRAVRPMLDLTLFRYPRFVGVQLLAAAPAYAYVVLLVLLPIRYIAIEGMSAVQAGHLMVALSAPLLVLPLVAGGLARWVSAATLCGAGLLLSAAGLLWLSRTGAGDLHAYVPPLLAIGIGIGLPWGLMDGLAVSVVPTERAGMATGIFSTTRVAGEGLALAVVSALLSALVASQLHGVSPTAAADAAQRLVTADLAGAAALLPMLSRATLAAAYESAFHSLLQVLAAITLLTAAVVFAFLGRGAAARSAEDCPHLAA